LDGGAKARRSVASIGGWGEGRGGGGVLLSGY